MRYNFPWQFYSSLFYFFLIWFRVVRPYSFSFVKRQTPIYSPPLTLFSYSGSFGNIVGNTDARLCTLIWRLDPCNRAHTDGINRTHIVLLVYYKSDIDIGKRKTYFHNGKNINASDYLNWWQKKVCYCIANLWRAFPWVMTRTKKVFASKPV